MTIPQRWIIVGILALAAVLRFSDIQQPLVDKFSWREASTAMMADNFRTRSWNVFYPEVSWTGPGPSYQRREFQIVSYITAILQALFGWQDWFGRLVAAVFGLWTLFALHRLVDTVWGATHAHFAAFVYALMPGAILIESSFLPEPAMLALVTTAIWLFARYLPQGPGYLLPISGALFTLGTMAKLPGFAASASVVYLTALCYLRDGTGKTRKITLVSAVSLLAITAYYSWALYLGNSYPPYHVAGQGFVWDDGIQSFLSEYFYVGDAWEDFQRWYLGLPILGLFIVGALSTSPPTRFQDLPMAVWVFHVWLAAALFLYLLAAREISSNPWNFHIFSVPLAVIAGRGLYMIARLESATPATVWGMTRLAIVGAIMLFVGTLPALDLMKAPIAATGARLGTRLNELSKPGDLVIAVSTTVGDPVAVYYSRRRGWLFPPGGGAVDWSQFVGDDEAKAQLEELRDLGADWFGVTRVARDSRWRTFVDHHKALLAHLDATAVRIPTESEFIIYRLSND